MKRRTFLALSTAAVVSPQELIAPAVKPLNPTIVGTYEGIRIYETSELGGFMYSEELARALRSALVPIRKWQMIVYDEASEVPDSAWESLSEVHDTSLGCDGDPGIHSRRIRRPSNDGGEER